MDCWFHNELHWVSWWTGLSTFWWSQQLLLLLQVYKYCQFLFSQPSWVYCRLAGCPKMEHLWIIGTHLNDLLEAGYHSCTQSACQSTERNSMSLITDSNSGKSSTNLIFHLILDMSSPDFLGLLPLCWLFGASVLITTATVLALAI